MSIPRKLGLYKDILMLTMFLCQPAKRDTGYVRLHPGNSIVGFYLNKNKIWQNLLSLRTKWKTHTDSICNNTNTCIQGEIVVTTIFTIHRYMNTNLQYKHKRVYKGREIGVTTIPTVHKYVYINGIRCNNNTYSMKKCV